MLRSFKSADWPNMKQAERSNDFKGIYDLAYPKHLRIRKKVSSNEISNMFKKAKLNE